jgi:hypothetical protein
MMRRGASRLGIGKLHSPARQYSVEKFACNSSDKGEVELTRPKSMEGAGIGDTAYERSGFEEIAKSILVNSLETSGGRVIVVKW